MEDKFTFSYNGQEIEQDDVATIADNAALADDRVLAELLRLAPNIGSVARAVLPYGSAGDNAATVTPTTSADGSIFVTPFRVVIGSRTNVGVDALKGWRDIRSAVFVGSSTSLAERITLAANSSGHARWDLIYASVAVDQPGANVTRYVKDTGGNVAVQNIPPYLTTTITISTVQGTPSTSPALPATPADSGSTYIVPLGYVAVPNGFSASSTIEPWWIYNVASPSPAGFSKIGGANLSAPNAQPTATQLAAWANGTTPTVSARSPWLLPPEMRGAEDLIVGLSFLGTNPSNWSHTNGAIVDNSRDWRQRIFESTIFIQAGGSAHFAWDRASGTTNLIPAFAHNTTTPEVMAGNLVKQLGQSFVLDAANLPGTPPTGSVVCFADSTVLTGLTNGFGLYVDTAGALRLYVNGISNNSQAFVWIRSSGAMPSY